MELIQLRLPLLIYLISDLGCRLKVLFFILLILNSYTRNKRYDLLKPDDVHERISN